MTEFTKFPKTPHLLWLGRSLARQDKVLSTNEAAELLSHELVVEEKIDGANLGLSLTESGALQAQNRGSVLSYESAHPQFKMLPRWIEAHRGGLAEVLTPKLIVYGEWCYAKHSIHYTRLPDWFLTFDVYDRTVGKFWSADRRDGLARRAGLATVPHLARGRFDFSRIGQLLGPSKLTDGPAEGIYVRLDRDSFLERRAKLVRAEFTQAISGHWSSGPILPNQVVGAGKRTAAV